MFYCSNKCCEIKISPYIKSVIIYNNFSNFKSGIFIFDPENQKILLVQSNGNLWGIPKGTIQKNESFADCAIREVYEETGLIFNTNNITNIVNHITSSTNKTQSILEIILITLIIL